MRRDYHQGHLPSRDEEGRMRIEIKGRNLTVGDELRERVEKKFAKVGRQVSALAEMEIELKEERNPSIRERCVAEATLHLKGTTLRARERSDDMPHSINLVAEDLHRQVKRHRDKRRGRRETARAQPQPGAP
jgi:ribosome hibernation promoting factor